MNIGKHTIEYGYVCKGCGGLYSDMDVNNFQCDCTVGHPQPGFNKVFIGSMEFLEELKILNDHGNVFDY